MSADAQDYPSFLKRLGRYERYDSSRRSRGPEKLAGIRRLLSRLGEPHRELRVVHIAGTNGKGMTAAMLGRLLGREGLSVGLYSSPHLLHIRERIQLGGKPAGEAEFAEVGHLVLNEADAMAGAEYLSYFDLLTAMGLLAFRRAGVDWTLLETGLGGLADATNAVDKELCIITRIGMDHMAVLGDDPRAIAGQKLGICRPGIPVVLARQEEGLEDWMGRRVARLGAPLHSVRELTLEPCSASGGGVRAHWPDGFEWEAELPERLVTEPRLAGAAAALTAAEILLGVGGNEERAARLGEALATELPGRLDYRKELRFIDPELPALGPAVLDGAHNAPALETLNAHLSRWGITEYTLIFGMQADKLTDSVSAPLAALLGGAARIVTLQPQTPRSPPPGQLHGFIREILPKAGRQPEITLVPGPREAFLYAAQHLRQPLVAAGSLWMVGSLMALLAPLYEPPQ